MKENKKNDLPKWLKILLKVISYAVTAILGGEVF